MNTRKAVNTLKAHLAINVKDVAGSIDFYTKMFGIEPSKVRTGYAKFDVANPPLNFTLNQVPFGERGALSHLGIQVKTTEDVLTMSVGERSGRQRMGSFHGDKRQSAGKGIQSWRRRGLLRAGSGRNHVEGSNGKNGLLLKRILRRRKRDDPGGKVRRS